MVPAKESPAKPKVALLLDAHRMDALVFHQFRLLSETLEPDVAVHLLLHAPRGTHRQDDRVIVLTDADIFPPGRKAKPGVTKIIPGNPDLKLIRAARLLPGYDAFLRIESDVVCMAGVRDTYLRMLARFAPYDFVAQAFASQKGDPGWKWWPTFTAPEEIRAALTPDRMLRAFLPILYYSRAFIDGYAAALDAGWGGHYEVTMPSFAAHAGLAYCDFRRKWPSITKPATFKATKLLTTDPDGAQFCHPVKTVEHLLAFHGLHDIFPEGDAPLPPRKPAPARAPARPAALKAPKLTLPPEAATLRREQYAKAQSILEFGSGGSTLVAAEREGTVTFSVESDADWADRMRHWFDAHPPKGQVHLHHADIGPTREWGYPQDDAHWRQFTDYPLSVWRRGDFRHPDVVLIDGRFRIGCFVGTLLNVTRPTRILFDDYVDRPRYHVVEQLCRPVSFAGRMAVFDARPTALHPSDLGRWIKLMQAVD